MDDLRELFFRSFEQFTEREAENILHGTSERNLCARWAPLLEMAAVEAGYDGYRADTEYNHKQGGQVKTILEETRHRSEKRRVGKDSVSTCNYRWSHALT